MPCGNVEITIKRIAPYWWEVTVDGKKITFEGPTSDTDVAKYVRESMGLSTW